MAFDRVIRRALAKSPADRFASAAAMERDLAGVVVGDSDATAAPAVALTRLVVLPFRVLRPDPEIDFLSLALADAVSTSLGGTASLVIRSSAAGSRFSVEAPDLPAIATTSTSTSCCSALSFARGTAWASPPSSWKPHRER